MTGTRLDRLFLLLENGSTRVIRKSAAEQLGEVQKLHPHELHTLLSKVHPYLVHAAWETRIAASQAVEAIAKHVPKWCPKTSLKKDEELQHRATQSRLQLKHFDVCIVLSQASSLLASEGTEFDVEDDIGLDQKEKLARQRELLNKRLGLDATGRMGVSSGDLFKEEDLVMSRQSPVAISQSSVKEVFQQHVLKAQHGEKLSSRELNRVKRKAKLLAKQTSRDDSKDGDTSESESAPCKLRKTSSFLVSQQSEDKLLMDSVPNTTLDLDQLAEWPFTGFCDVLMNELFNSSWEKRHGAAIGLREVIRLHGRGAGLVPEQTPAEQDESHSAWLEDIAVRVICVMALDRFGDYISDEVVAPVRESCAQTLGALLQLLDEDGIRQVAWVLVQLLAQAQWEVRHGGLLGLKYLLAVCKDLQESLLPQLIPVMFHGLQDVSDDVRAVAAASLVPVTDALLSPTLIPHVVPIIECLWSTLVDLDDLTASTNSIMLLLSSLLANPLLPDNSMSSRPLSEMVPRIWPFLRHNIKSVRKATLQTLITLLNRQKQHGGHAEWLVFILQDAFRHIYQRCLFEESQEIIGLLEEVWCLMLDVSSVDHVVAAVCPWLGVWLCLMMQPASLPFDPALLIEAKHPVNENTPSRARPASVSHPDLPHPTGIHKDYIGGVSSLGDNPVRRDIAVMLARLAASRLLGHLCSCFTRPLSVVPGAEGESPIESLANLLVFHLNSKSALQRMSIGFILNHWAKISKSCPMVDSLKLKLQECLTSCIYYDEIALSFTRMQTECQNFIACLKQAGLLNHYTPPSNMLSLDQAAALCSSVFDGVKGQLKPRQLATFEERRKGLEQTVSQTTSEHNLLSVRVQTSLATAVIEIKDLPQKMNPVVRPLMECLKREMNPDLQMWAAQSLSHLLDVCVERSPCPNQKIIKNLCTMLCSDPSFTPPLVPSTGENTYSGILTLNALQQGHEQVIGRGRRPTVIRQTVTVDVNIPLEATINQEDEEKRQKLVQRRGAAYGLSTAAKYFSTNLPDKLPCLWHLINLPFSAHQSDNGETGIDEQAQELVNALQLLQVLGPHLHKDLITQIVSRLESFQANLSHKFTCVRHMASRCLAMLCSLLTGASMNFVLDHVLPSLGACENLAKQEGGIEALSNIVEELGVAVVPYIVLLIVPVLGTMSDQTDSVRLMATHCFASLVRLMPLESGTESPADMSSHLVKQKEEERHFLEQLLDGSKIASYSIPVPIDAELRKYQQDGVNWLSFLNKYKLHGILCDDMGLGKTLMSLCILAGDHFQCDQIQQKTKQVNCPHCPSIVVCPPTLTGHWVYEVEKFVSADHLRPLHYTGPPSDRCRLQKLLPNHNLVVASYDVVRNDIDFFSSVKWNYCILDEGHIIKNSKTKLSQAVKRLVCHHRLILSGTPIQNNVLELWSLFDFLMPGFLGTEKQFQVRYGRPILQSRDAKSSSKDQEAGALAMESLHRQVLPFILRRLKENVLQDLPPKIIQDYYCDLSPLQVQLYEDFAKSRARSSVEETVLSAESKPKSEPCQGPGSANIFQALQYLKKLCNHPALVLNAQHPEYSSITAQLKARGSKLRSLEHSPKLTALQQLLTDCGIGVSCSAVDGESAPVVNQHRALIFCQLKSMLDILESDLLKCHMPDVTYLRLDGTVPAGNRHGIVNRFNNDPSIDLLLLTTHVGGLGLNLTGADTVIFVEHDWNPMKDLQAMDRAHRIGQKRVVNVYRLITRATLEEKIMGLQKFKLNIANTVISQENASLSTMGTHQLLDLFSLDHKKAQDHNQDKAADKLTLKDILSNEKELWSEDQYETEYDLGKFMETLS